VAFHAGLGAVIVLGGWRLGSHELQPWSARSVVDSESAEANWVDLVQTSSLPSESPESFAAPRSTDPSEVANEAGRLGLASSGRAAAPDQGEGAGQSLPPAFRLDRSTVRAQLSNGARVYQPEHERTARVASSRQAERREPTVGVGDLSKTQRPEHQEHEDDVVAVHEAKPGEGQGTAQASEVSHRPTGAGTVLGQGPLATDQGERRFDVEQVGPARDSHAAPALSPELQPGRMDLSAASAPGPGDVPGRGPGESPGVIARPSQGSAASRSAPGGAGEGDAGERTRARHELEIRRRIHQFLRFPHRLALMLEQGETIVAFVVDANGRLVGAIEVVKSAGFPEFDEEAVAAVRRAAPFAPPGRALALSVRVPFQNPVVR
jgi:TonB family protein